MRPTLLEGFPSGQRDQTVNLTAPPSVVRIHLPPPSYLEETAKTRVLAVFLYFMPYCNTAEFIRYILVPHLYQGRLVAFKFFP